MPRRTLPTLMLVVTVWAVPGAGQTAAECTEWRDCRAQAEEAIEAKAFEHAHDLAWRAVQRGPKDDSDLMFLLARAQCLSGRPDDALVMVRRLAERGIATEAATHEDLARARALPGWDEVAVLVARANGAALPATAAVETGPAGDPETTAGSGDTAGAAAPSAPTPEAAASTAAPTNAGGSSAAGGILSVESVPFSRDRFVTAGLAYDAVSHRFLVGDRAGRKVRVVGEGLDQAVDLVRAESAGFSDIRALAIDPKRGDLWVASADGQSAAGTLHRLQLISGRPIKAYPLDDEARTLVPIDVAVTAAGSVLVLGQHGALVRLKPGVAAVEDAVELGLSAVTSIATETESRAYVAHRDGISRVDLASGKGEAVTAPAEVSLAGFVRLRSFRRGLIGVRAAGDGTGRLVRLVLQSNGRRVRSATTFDLSVELTDGAIAFSVSGDEVALVADASSVPPTADSASPTPPALVVRRIRFQ